MKTRTRKIRDCVASAKQAKTRKRLVEITQNLYEWGCTPSEIAELLNRDIRDIRSFMTDIDEEILRNGCLV